MWAQAVAPREESQTCPHRITLMVGTSKWPLLGRHCCRGVRLTAGEAGASQGWHSLIHSPITPVGLVFLISTLSQLIPLKTNGPLATYGDWPQSPNHFVDVAFLLVWSKATFGSAKPLYLDSDSIWLFSFPFIAVGILEYLPTPQQTTFWSSPPFTLCKSCQAHTLPSFLALLATGLLSTGPADEPHSRRGCAMPHLVMLKGRKHAVWNHKYLLIIVCSSMTYKQKKDDWIPFELREIVLSFAQIVCLPLKKLPAHLCLP